MAKKVLNVSEVGGHQFRTKNTLKMTLTVVLLDPKNTSFLGQKQPNDRRDPPPLMANVLFFLFAFFILPALSKLIFRLL